MDTEQAQLDTLLSTYDLPEGLRGELTFAALDDEARLDIASPFFQGEGNEVPKAMGPRAPLLSLLEELMM